MTRNNIFRDLNPPSEFLPTPHPNPNPPATLPQPYFEPLPQPSCNPPAHPPTSSSTLQLTPPLKSNLQLNPPVQPPLESNLRNNPPGRLRWRLDSTGGGLEGCAGGCNLRLGSLWGLTQPPDRLLAKKWGVLGGCARGSTKGGGLVGGLRWRLYLRAG